MDPQTALYNRQRLLLQRYLDRTITPGQFAELMDLLNLELDEPGIEALLDEALQQASANPAESAIDWEAMCRRILRQRPIRKITRWLAAASILLVIGTSIWIGWERTHQRDANPPTVVAQPKDVPPGSNKATLTLASGQQIPLDPHRTDTTITQGPATIAATNGRLTYNTAHPQEAALTYNTLTTPRGGQYQLTLPDGSKVWLNAASQITYPTAFTGASRTVSIQGEAYLEVAPDPAQPFLVKLNDSATVRVLGTTFNVKAYPDEAATFITLLKGKIQIAARTSLILSPGHQAIIADGLHLADQVDTATVMAWRNGRFAFENADLPAVMRELARWYNITVVFEGPVPTRHFSGRLGRNLSLNQLLRLMSGLDIHYSIETTDKENRLIIKP